MSVRPPGTDDTPQTAQAARDAQAAMLPGPWWSIYRDARLDRLMDDAMHGNANLEVSIARWRQASALEQAARAAWWPGVQASGSLTRSSVAVPALQARSIGNTASAAVGASWEPDLWGRIAASVEAGRAGTDASIEDWRAMRLSIQAGVAQAWLSVCAIDAQQRLFDETAVVYERSLRIARNRYRAGIAPPTDVSQAETQLENVRAQSIEAGIARGTQVHALAVLAGRSPSTLAVDERCTLPDIPALPTALPSVVVALRPDIVAARRRAEQANANIGVARAAWFPSITLGAQAGTRGQAVADLLSLPFRFWSVVPAIAQTLFDGGLRTARERQAQAAFDLAAASYRLTVLTAFQEVEDALWTLDGLQRERQTLQRVVAAATRTATQTTNQYEAGTVSYLNVVTAQAGLLSARKSLIDVDARRHQATVALVRAMALSRDEDRDPAARATPAGRER